MKIRKPLYGDIIEVSTPRGLAYFQYVSQHQSYGDVIRVLPGLFATRPPSLEGLVQQAGFFAFYPVTAAVKKQMIEIITNMPIPEGYKKPQKLRRAGARSNDGRVLTWVITEKSGDFVKEELNKEERSLPIVQLWNHEMLVHRLASGWRPEKEV